jgi:hypothetical protein
MTPDVPVYLVQSVGRRLRRRLFTTSPYDAALALAV